MTTSWGSWEYSGGNGMRVGIDASTHTAVTHSSTSVTWTIKVYTQNQYAYSDGQTLNYSGDISGSHGYTNNDGGTAQLRDTLSDTYTYSTYGSSPGTRHFTATVSGAYNGVTPTKTWDATIPARPYTAPTAPSAVTLTRNSDTQATLTWTRHSTSTAPYSSQTVQMRTYSGSSWGAWTTVATVSATATSYVKTGLSANHIYQMQVRANSTEGSSAYVASSNIYMTPATPGAGHSYLHSSGTAITTTWSDNAYTSTTISWVIQRSVAGGAYSNIGTVSPQSVLTFTDSSIGAGTNQYRIAAVTSSGPLTSGYAYANLISTSVAPLAPTLLSPNGTLVDFVNDAVVFTWQHNPGADSAVQSHFTIETSINSGSTWQALAGATGVASSASTFTLPAGTLVNGVPYLWRVRTEGVVANGYGPNSASATVEGSTKPTVTLTLPAAVTNTSPIVASWIYNQDELSPQVLFEALLYDATGLILLEGVDIYSAATSYSFTYPAITGTTYRIEVAVLSAAGVWSDYAITDTDFVLLPPALATVTGTFDTCTGTVLLHLEPGTTVPGTNVDADSVTIERRVDGGDWVILGTGILIPTDYVDILPLTDGLNEYRITAVSTLPSSAVGLIVSVYGVDGVAAGDPLWVWISYGDNFEFVLRMRGDLSIAETTGRVKAQQNFLGRAKPVALVGQNTSRTVTVGGSIRYDRRCPLVDDGCTYDSPSSSWQDAGTDSEVVCYRDFTGRRLFGTLSDVVVTDGIWPGKADVGFTVTEVDFTERYVQLVTA